MKKLVLVVAVLVALCVVSAAAADNPRLTFSPDPIFVGDPLVFAGCGFTPNTKVLLQAIHNTKPDTWILQVDDITDTNGCFDTADYLPFLVPTAGKVTASVFEGSHKDVTINFTVG